MLNVTLVLSTLSIYLGFITKVLDDNSCYSAIKTHHQITIATFVRFIYGMYKGKCIAFLFQCIKKLALEKTYFLNYKVWLNIFINWTKKILNLAPQPSRNFSGF